MLSAKSIKEIYDDPGCFRYFDDGFCIAYDRFNKELKWKDITELIAVNNEAPDRIDLHIVYGNKYFTISEALPGWYQFVLTINNLFPTIVKNWDIDILQPAFKEKTISIYRKGAIAT